MKHTHTVFLALALLAGCSSTPLQEGGDAANARASSVGMEQFGRMPLPVGSKLRSGDSLILGVGDNWLGRAVMEVPTDAGSTFGFFADQFPRQGWTPVAAMRGKKSLLVYTRAERTATLEVEDAGLIGPVIVTITVSPTPSAPGNAGNAPGVVVQPLGQPRRP